MAETFRQKAREQTLRAKGVPQIFKKDGQVFVRDTDGREFQAKLLRTDDGKIVAEYTKIDAETGEISVHKVPLRRKKKEQGESQQRDPGAESDAKLETGRKLGRGRSMRKRAMSGMLKKGGSYQEPDSEGGDDQGGDDDAAGGDKAEGGEGEGEGEAQGDGEGNGEGDHDNMDDFEQDIDLDEDVRHDIEFETTWSSAERLVIEHLADGTELVEFNQHRASIVVGHEVLGAKGKGKDADAALDAGAFRWTEKAESPKETFPPIEAADDFEGVQAREDGIEPASFNLDHYNSKRKHALFINVVPHRFKRMELSKPIEDMSPAEKVVSVEELQHADPSKVICIKIDKSVRLNKAQEERLLATINKFTRCEILVLRNLGIRRVDLLNLPYLLAADFVGNHISDIKRVVRFCKASRQLFQLDLRYNEVAKKPVLQPFIAQVLSVEWYSGHVITEAERHEAVVKFGTDSVKNMYRAMKIWEAALLRVPNVSQMETWQPSTLQHLKLVGMSLDRIFVGSMTGLITLDVSGNKLTSLQLAGLEKLSDLAAINVSDNYLSNVEDLEVFQWMPSLRVVLLDKNQWPENYRFRLLYSCRNLRGKNHWPGLIEIDGKKVRRSEVLEAWRMFGGMNAAELEKLKWQMTIIHFAGHYHLRLQGFPLRFAKLQFPSKGLGYADVSTFMNLQILDLSNNNIVQVKGLDHLDRLRQLNLFGNASLDIAFALRQLKYTDALVDVRLAPSEAHANDVKGPYRANVIASLFHHSYLREVDGHPITLEERVNACRTAFPKAAQGSAEAYGFNVKLTTCATLPDHRSYAPEDVVPGKQWEAGSVLILNDMTHLGITDQSHLNLPHFTNLMQLNLSHNEITDVLRLKLHTLKRLKIVDLSYNRIKTAITAMAKHFDQFPALEVLCLRGNVSYTTAKHRLELIGKMEVFREFECKLSVVDVPVSLSERMKGWRSQGGSEKMVEDAKLAFQLNARLPLHIPPNEVTVVNLNKAGLQAALALSQYPNLQFVTARGNNLKSIASMAELSKLRLLDVRDNKLTNVQEVVDVANALGSLEVVAATGNGFSTGPKAIAKYRAQVISAVPKLKEVDCALQFIDDDEVQPWEVIKHAFRTKSDAERLAALRWEWAVHVWRQLDRHNSNAETITELDIAESRLQVIEVKAGMFPRLRKLSLAHNKLVVASVPMLKNIPALEELDLSFNIINNMKELADLTDALPKLRALYIDGNPCCREDNDNNRLQLLQRQAQNQYLNAPLRLLNGFAILVGERVRALELAKLPDFDEPRLRVFRTELALEAVRARTDAQQINLNGFDLKDLSPLLAFKRIEFLDLSYNNLETLVGQGLETLPNLFWLDLRKNSFVSLMEAAVRPLMPCHKLRHIYLQHSTKLASETNRVSDYIVNPVCHTLRGLESCDQNKNPVAMNELAVQGAEYLFHHYGLSRNSLLEIDLTNRGLEEEEFPRFCTALSYVHCERLWCDQNPWTSYSNYRFVLLFFGTNLVELDGRKVGMDERNNAQRVVRAMKLDKRLFYLEKAANTAAAAQGMDPIVAGMLAGSAQANAGTAAQIETAPVGTLLSKWEILINFLQVYAILFTLTINWPDWWYDFNIRWVYIVDIDLDLGWVNFLKGYQYMLKFVVLALLPVALILMYQSDPKEEKWLSYYVKQTKRSRTIHALDVLLLCLLSVYAGFVVDYVYYNDDADHRTSWERLGDGEYPTGLCQSVMFSVFGFGVVYGIVRYFVIRTFRKNHQSTTFWFEFVKLKKKLALFLISVCYQPIARNVMVHFARRFYDYDDTDGWKLGRRLVDYPECMTAADKARSDSGGYSQDDEYCCQHGMPDRQCLGSIGDLEWFHYVSVILCAVYIVGIPYFFYRLIFRGTTEIDRNFNVPQKEKEMLEREVEYKKQKAEANSRRERKLAKKNIKRNRKQFRAAWARYCREYTNAQNYLYVSYKRNNRYMKVYIMFEKLLLLAILLFFAAAAVATWRTVAGTVVVGFYFLSVVFTQPFSDRVEDVMDIALRFTNTFTAFIGVVGDRLHIDRDAETWLQSTMLGTVNLVALVLVLLVFLGTPIRVWMVRRQARVTAAKAQEEAESLLKKSKPSDLEVGVGAKAAKDCANADSAREAMEDDGEADRERHEAPPAIALQSRHNPSRGVLRAKSSNAVANHNGIPMQDVVGDATPVGDADEGEGQTQVAAYGDSVSKGHALAALKSLGNFESYASGSDGERTKMEDPQGESGGEL